MQSHVATEVGIKNRKVLALIVVDGIDGFHTHIQSYDKIVEIET